MVISVNAMLFVGRHFTTGTSSTKFLLKNFFFEKQFVDKTFCRQAFRRHNISSKANHFILLICLTVSGEVQMDHLSDFAPPATIEEFQASLNEIQYFTS